MWRKLPTLRFWTVYSSSPPPFSQPFYPKWEQPHRFYWVHIELQTHGFSAFLPVYRKRVLTPKMPFHNFPHQNAKCCRLLFIIKDKTIYSYCIISTRISQGYHIPKERRKWTLGVLLFLIKREKKQNFGCLIFLSLILTSETKTRGKGRIRNG